MHTPQSADPFNEALLDSINSHSGRPFLLDDTDGRSMTYAEFGEALGTVWLGLASRGISPGQIVALESENSMDLAVMLLGIITYGGIAMPLNPKLQPGERSTLLAHSGAVLLVKEAGGNPAPETPSSVSFTELLRTAVFTGTQAVLGRNPGGSLLIYTSGTTGNPKGVLLRGGTMAKNIAFAVSTFGLDENHRKLCLLPLFHTFGFISDLCTMAFCGGLTVVQKTFELSRIAGVGAAIRKHGINSFSAVPLIFELLLRMDADLGGPTLEFCVSGAAALPEKLRIGFRERFGAEIIPAYGLTECTCFCTISPRLGIKPGSVGAPAGVELVVLDEAETPLPAGAIGEICVRGESVMADGYFRQTTPCFSSRHPGFFKTGDLGYLDGEGYAFITGRKKNMVIRGGEKVYLEDVDRCLLEIVGIRDAATVKAGEGAIEPVVSYLVAAEGAVLDAAAVRRSVIDRIGVQKCPDRFVFIERIPRTPTNKVRIRELADMAAGDL